MRSLIEKALAKHFVGERVRTSWGWGTVIDVDGDLLTVELDNEDRNVVVSANGRSDDLIRGGNDG